MNLVAECIWLQTLKDETSCCEDRKPTLRAQPALYRAGRRSFPWGLHRRQGLLKVSHMQTPSSPLHPPASTLIPQSSPLADVALGGQHKGMHPWGSSRWGPSGLTTAVERGPGQLVLRAGVRAVVMGCVTQCALLIRYVWTLTN